MRTLIAGYGEIGYALYQILRDYPIGYVDIDKKGHRIEFEIPEQVEILHICFGYSDKFIDYVKQYQEEFKPKYTIIYSTVDIGTTRKLGAIHSPVTGKHPFLEDSFRTFARPLAGERTSEVADYFRRVGLKICLYEKPETTEAGKLFELRRYGVMIEMVKEFKEQCDKLQIPFHEAYTLMTQNYNQGYQKLDNEEFTMPILQPIMKPIGGHCIRENAPLSSSKFNQFLV